MSVGKDCYPWIQCFFEAKANSTPRRVHRRKRRKGSRLRLTLRLNPWTLSEFFCSCDWRTVAYSFVCLRYFVKMETHTPFVLKNRFAIGNARTTTRGEADIFARKPVPRKSLSDYKVENFVKPGLIHKVCRQKLSSLNFSELLLSFCCGLLGPISRCQVGG